MSADLTKLRLQMKRAQHALELARQEKESAELAFHQRARAEGVCPVCLQQDPDQSHHGTCYVTVAAPQPVKLYAWEGSYGLLSFCVMAESEDEARAAVRKHIAEQLQGEYARDYVRNDWPNNHELKILEPGQVAENGNG